jgi:hypothetical protein
VIKKTTGMIKIKSPPKITTCNALIFKGIRKRLLDLTEMASGLS